MNTATLHPNLQAADLAIEIADAAAVTTIEAYARRAPTNYPRGIWDVSAPDEAERWGDLTDESMRADLQRAVQYLDLRRLLFRPVAGNPQYVAFTEAE